MRRCFIHIGTHKTGTTSLQFILSTHRCEFEERRYYYPLVGRDPGAPYGQHNIAWEISNDHRFCKENGCFADLINEIKMRSHNIILSSEDFECSVFHTERFAEFIRGLQSCNLDVKIIAYLRNQIEYAKSLYPTLLSYFGFDIPFSKYIEEIFERGQFRWRDWIFSFDYDEFLQRLQSIDGAGVIVRSYDVVKNGALIGDFLSILGLQLEDLGIDGDVRRNEGHATSTAVEFYYRNCVGHSPHPSEQAALTSLFRSEDPRVDMSVQSKLLLIGKFDASNKRVFRAYGISEFEHMRPERIGSEPSKEMWMVNIFAPGLRDAVNEKVKSLNNA